MAPRARATSGAAPAERRARQRLLYTADQLLGRAPIYTRRTSDKWRLVVHLGGSLTLIGLAGWWVLPVHAWAGPVLLTLTASHGVHLGDLPALAFLAVALRSAVVLATGSGRGRD
ncbi:MAG: hypothetical protein AB7H43_10215 [Acidimicrobiia bacterium]